MALTAEEHCALGRRQPLTPQGNKDAKQNYEDALGVDPKYLPAYAEYSYVFVREAQNGWGASRKDSLDRAEELADKAVDLANDPSSVWHNDFRARWYRAMVYWNQGDFIRSFDEYDAARLLIKDPERAVRDRADLDADMAEALIYHGQPNRALAMVEDAMARNKDFHYWYLWIYGRALYAVGRYADAIKAIDDIAKMTTPPNDVRLVKAASLARLGRLDEAKSVMADFSVEDPNWTVRQSADYPYGSESARKHWIEGLRLAGLRPN